MTTKEFITYYNETFDAQGRELILEFFVAFSRFEYSLKASNFIMGNDRVMPNWDAYVNTISATFVQTKNQELNEAVNYIIQHPPKIQSVSNNVIVWSDRLLDQNAPLLYKLRLHISDIRNNLFHGGKFNGTFAPENSRNYKLLKSAIIILDDWLEISPNINYNFSQPIA